MLGKKIFICAGCELSYVYDYLKRIESKTYHTFVSKTSMDIFGELNNPNSIIREYSADYYILSQIQLFKSLLVRYQSEKYFSNPLMFQSDLEEIFVNLNYSIKEIRSFSKAPIFLITMCYLTNASLFGNNEYLINNKSSYIESKLPLLSQ